MYVTKKNFIIDDIPEDSTVLYFFFDRGSISSPHNGPDGFINLSREEKILLKILTYTAHCADDVKVYLVYMEPNLKDASTAELSPQLRCMLTHDFCLMFVLSSNSPGYDDEEDFITRAVLATKRLICVDANLVGTTDAYIMRNDPTKTMDLISQYNFNRWCYDIEVLSNKRKAMRYQLDKLLHQSETVITQNSLFGAVAKYFKGCGDLTELSTDELLEFLFENITSAEIQPAFKLYLSKDGVSPITDFLTKRQFDSNILVFQYGMELLINKDNFTLFESAGIMTYQNCTKADIESCKDELMENKPVTETPHDFDLNWPHLKTFRKTVVEDICTKGLQPMEALRVRTKLFETTVLNNAQRFVTEPTKNIYIKINQIIGKRGVYGLAALKGSKLDFLQSKNPLNLPKISDFMFLSLVFVKILGLCRCVQAFFSLIHIFHTTAPKWKTCKIMLANHTRGGMGKTHTMNALINLIKIPGLFDSLSSITDAAFKYSEMTIGKVMVIDDIALSHSQQKNSKREDSSLGAQFKSLLDMGHTKNIVVEKDAKLGNFKAPTKIMVYNTAFIWNTNTTTTFPDAMMDRCIILGSEPIKNFKIKSQISVDDDIKKYELQERFKNLYLRHHLLQTLLFTTTPKAAGPSEQSFRFLKQTIELLEKKFPTLKHSQSPLRSTATLMDLIIGETVRMAITAVTEWWIPPWTVVPRIEDDASCRDYLLKLETARLNAFKCIDMCELLVEIMAHIKLYLPMSAVEIITINFNQASAGIFENVFKLISSAIALPGKKIFEKSINSMTDQNIVVINKYKKCSIKELDTRALHMGTELYFNKDGIDIRLVEDISPETIKLNGFFAYELFKLLGSDQLKETFEHCKELFLEYYNSHRTLNNTLNVSGLHKNILLFCNACGVIDNDHIWGSEGSVTISPNLWGINMELYLEGKVDIPIDELCTDYREPKLDDWSDRKHVLENTSHNFLTSRISWFSIDYVQKHLSNLHSHSCCGMVPSGNVIEFYAAESVDNSFGWEHQEAMKIYKKYGVNSELKHYYLCYSAENSSALASEDEYLKDIAENFPKNNTEMLHVLNARYGKQPEHIKNTVKEITKKRKMEMDNQFIFKKILTENGQKILNILKSQSTSSVTSSEASSSSSSSMYIDEI